MLNGYRGYVLALAVTLCALFGFVPLASAGPVEQLVQLAIHPRDPNTMLVRYVNGGGGMLRTHDGGQTWRLACDAMQLDPQTRSGTSVIAGDGSTWMGVFDGLWHDDTHDCGWQRESTYDGEWFGDLINHPTDPDVLFAVTSTASPIGEHKLNGVLRRDASGTWSDFGVKEEMLVTRLVVASHGDGLRMYVSAIKGQTVDEDGGTPRPNYFVRVSDDSGATWQEFPVPDVGGTFRLQGVDPTNGDRLLASVNRYSDSAGGGEDSVLVSSDRGEHFVEYMTLAEIGGVAFAPDGRVWIGDAGDAFRGQAAPGGLWFAPSLDASASRLPMADYPVQCLAYNHANDTLYACQHWSFGTVDRESGAYRSLLTLRDVQDFVQCSGVDSAAACETQLCGAYCGFGHFGGAPICQVYDTPTCGKAVAMSERGYSMIQAASVQYPPTEQDAGASQNPPQRNKDTGCAVTEPGAHSASAPFAMAFAALAWRVRSSRRRAQCSQRSGSASPSSDV
jgi:hypothetical protein